MSADVVVVDLGLGNLASVVRGLGRAGAGAVEVTADPATVEAAPRLVVPGQGAFRDAAAALDGPLGEAVRAQLARDTPYLGICLGMQVLFEASDEAPGRPGLGWLPGRVTRFPRGLRDGAGRRLKVPHIGWNAVRSSDVVVGDDRWFYFTHSYRCEPADPGVVVGEASYGAPFCAVVRRGRALGCQFHPEKSQGAGRAMLRGFLAS